MEVVVSVYSDFFSPVRKKAQQVRHEQQRLRVCKRRIILQLAAVELIDGVEIHRRNARAGKGGVGKSTVFHTASISASTA